MGSGPSSLEPELQKYLPDTQERYIGLENLGNTCYANAVLQVLFRCDPFKPRLLQYLAHAKRPSATKSTLLLESASALFHAMQSNADRTGTQEAGAFMSVLRRLHEGFRESIQQDAQEFYSFLVNNLAEAVQSLQSKKWEPETQKAWSGVLERYEKTVGKTFVHANFEGLLRSEMQCLTCGTKTWRDEAFFDLSLDIEDGCSLSSCLRRFCRPERLEATEGFHCESAHCSALGQKQPAEKRIVLSRLPNMLVLHLKRFRYDPVRKRFVKLFHRVSFSLELRVWSSEEPDTLFRLKGAVIHVGLSAGSGHYISCVQVDGAWFLFNDDNVKLVSPAQLSSFFGGDSVGSSYMLFYEKCETLGNKL